MALKISSSSADSLVVRNLGFHRSGPGSTTGWGAEILCSAAEKTNNKKKQSPIHLSHFHINKMTISGKIVGKLYIQQN